MKIARDSMFLKKRIKMKDIINLYHILNKKGRNLDKSQPSLKQ